MWYVSCMYQFLAGKLNREHFIAIAKTISKVVRHQSDDLK